MTKKESDLSKVLQKEFSKSVKESQVKHNYYVTLKTSDPDYNLILIPADEESVDPQEYVIYYTTDMTIDEEAYYCTT